MFGGMMDLLGGRGMIHSFKLGIALCKWILVNKGVNELVTYLNGINLGIEVDSFDAGGTIGISNGSELAESFANYVNEEAKTRGIKNEIAEKYSKIVEGLAADARKEYEEKVKDLGDIGSSGPDIAGMSTADFLKEIEKGLKGGNK